jgi:GNAT superfamily N-acetyltransferase
MATTPERAPVRIRPATPDDGERVAAMCAGLSAEEGLGIESRFTGEAFRRDGFGPQPAFACLIAETAGQPVGYALYCHDYDTDRLCRSIYLADLYVEKAARRRGLGRALMAACAAAGRRQGAQVMMWSVLKGNAAARAFYAGIGEEIDDQIETGLIGPAFRRLVETGLGAADTTLRTATAADCPTVARLLAAMLDDIGLPRADGAAERLRADGFGRAPCFTVVIAERAGRAIGYALFWPTYDTEAARRGGWLSDLYVVADERRNGLAGALMTEVARRTAAAGGSYLVWLVHAENARARAFYCTIAEEWLDGLPCICQGERFRALAARATF